MSKARLTPDHRLPPTWQSSDRFVPRTLVRPVLRFMELEAAAGIVMLIAAVLALAWANSPWRGGYEALWSTPLEISLGSFIHLDDMTLHTWVNDGAMALFFLLAGLEIKRQLVLGELRDRRASALPALAALGGMVCPALIYTAINLGHPGEPGWGIPVATDIAFAVGIVALAGSAVPLGARIFILTLAVVDDIGGIIVIAIFYADDVRPAWLLVAAAAVLATTALSRSDVRSLVPYIALGSVCWLALHEAGVEAAIVGVIFGMLTPLRSFYPQEAFGAVARSLVARIESGFDDNVLTDDEYEANEVALDDLARLSTETMSPLERIESRLGPWVALVIVPLFAFANAGVHVDVSGIDGRVFLGVVAGLVVGKTIGVFTFAWVAVRLGLGALPGGTTWRHMLGLSVTAGIGFTVALYVAQLSFDEAGLIDSAKVGVLAASVVAGALGLTLLRAGTAKERGADSVALDRDAPAGAPSL